ncbi:MAG: MoxR family ATPase [Clostridia bacterium]|nr:MoxR family ATPase [Clostridia bacterium]
MAEEIREVKEQENPEVAALSQRAKALIEEVEKVVIGKHNEIVLLVTSMLAGGHVLIEDVPGTGKTTLAAALAKAAGLDFNRAQFTPDVMASDITGFNVYNRQKEQFEFNQGLVMTNVLLADEINRASPKTQSALLEAMEESKVTVDGVTYPVPDPFMVIATQNPTGYVGTYPLPEAQLDRFALKLSMGYPTLQEEVQIIADRRTANPLEKVRPVTDMETIRMLRAMVQNVTVAPEIAEYIVSLTHATRKSRKLSLGASPRASLLIMKLAQAFAFLRERDYVKPEDVAFVFAPGIAHRIVLSQEARLNRETAEGILAELLRGTEVPFHGERYSDKPNRKKETKDE